MTTTDVYALPQSSLNGFLFAEVGAEANGMMLRVISVFARAGQDPWREAENLAQLSPAKAISVLSRLISGMHPSAWSQAEAEPIAARLVALLPTAVAGHTDRKATTKPGKGGMLPLLVALFCLVLAVGYTISGMGSSADQAPVRGEIGTAAPPKLR